MPTPRRPTADPTYDSGRRDLVISGHEVSAALTEIRRDDPMRARLRATHIITVTPPANAAPGSVIDIDGVAWEVAGSRNHPTLKNYRELLVRPKPEQA